MGRMTEAPIEADRVCASRLLRHGLAQYPSDLRISQLDLDVQGAAIGQAIHVFDGNTNTEHEASADLHQLGGAWKEDLRQLGGDWKIAMNTAAMAAAMAPPNPATFAIVPFRRQKYRANMGARLRQATLHAGSSA